MAFWVAFSALCFARSSFFAAFLSAGFTWSSSRALGQVAGGAAVVRRRTALGSDPAAATAIGRGREEETSRVRSRSKSPLTGTLRPVASFQPFFAASVASLAR